MYVDFFHYSTILQMYFPYDFLNNISFSFPYFTVRIQYIIHITHKISVSELCVLSGKLLVNSRLPTVKYLGSQNLCRSLQLHEELDT